MEEVTSDPEKRYIRARHSWITEGLDEADVSREPAELFHGTRRTNWEGIKRYGLMSERALLGRKGRLHLHFCRAREHIKQGSEVMIKVHTSALYRRAAAYWEALVKVMIRMVTALSNMESLKLLIALTPKQLEELNKGNEVFPDRSGCCSTTRMTY